MAEATNSPAKGKKKSKISKKWLILFILLLAGAGAGTWLYLQHKKRQEELAAARIAEAVKKSKFIMRIDLEKPPTTKEVDIRQGAGDDNTQQQGGETF